MEVSYSVGIVDVVGVKANGDVYVVEAKASQSDLHNDMRTRGYEYGYRYNKDSKLQKYESSRQFDFIYYIVADGVGITDIPTFIGVLSEDGTVKRRAVRRDRAHTDKTLVATFLKIAKALSWRKYGYVINHEQEQIEFSLCKDYPE